jgi:hypothetical protein
MNGEPRDVILALVRTGLISRLTVCITLGISELELEALLLPGDSASPVSESLRLLVDEYSSSLRTVNASYLRERLTRSK